MNFYKGFRCIGVVVLLCFCKSDAARNTKTEATSLDLLRINDAKSTINPFMRTPTSLNQTKKDAGYVSSNSEAVTEASLLLAESKKIPVSERTRMFYAADLTIITNGPCSSPVELYCDAHSKYRIIDGSCNNLENPRWGKAQIPLLRYLQNDYDDGISSPRGVYPMLPSARAISQKVLGEIDSPHNSASHMVMQWGQFLTHDLVLTPIERGDDNSRISCCENGIILPPYQSHPACFPIVIPKKDPQFGPLYITCMEFTRSVGATFSDCVLDSKEQLNQLSAYIDGSNVYGSNYILAQNLREQQNGLLKFFEEDYRDLLQPASGGFCQNSARPCFEAGDRRVNQQAGLTVMHIVWMREHNRLATELATYNPYWDDEKLYQEARRIVWAEMQHITYNEWLPVILGTYYMETNSLTCESPHWYDQTIDASITNSFTTAALRFGHSLIQGMVDLYSEYGQKTDSLRLRDISFRNEHLYEPKMMDAHIRGLANQKSQKGDRNFDPEIKHHLFERLGQTVGLDLPALNIQRGRDHGIPSYVEFRKICGLSVPTSFKDMKKIVENHKMKNVKRLERMYDYVEDIDLYVGGMMEKKVTGALVGQTFQCLLGDQFKRLRFGDRFFYLDQDEYSVTKLTESQLYEIKKVTLSRILCDNSDDIHYIQKDVFNVEGARVSCQDEYEIKRINIGEWTE